MRIVTAVLIRYLKFGMPCHVSSFHTAKTLIMKRSMSVLKPTSILVL